jgi:hypothetical protein
VKALPNGIPARRDSCLQSGMSHINGHNRSQTLLLPESRDEYVGLENPVRFIDAFVDGLDLTAAGFIRVVSKVNGPARKQVPTIVAEKKAIPRHDQNSARRDSISEQGAVWFGGRRRNARPAYPWAKAVAWSGEAAPRGSPVPGPTAHPGWPSAQGGDTRQAPLNNGRKICRPATCLKA